ncbi:hypothetical protein RQP46_001414 [Phenoliferia psychrophenolica]
MLSYASVPIVAAMATVASAGLLSNAGIPANLDFVSEFTAIVSNTITFATGNYLVSNVATGHNLYFDRVGTVGLYTGPSTAGVNLESVTYKDVTGTSVTGMVVSGTTSQTMKCLAAQWNFDYKLAKRARDEYAVPYECQLGANGNGMNNVDTNKGLWVFNDVDCPSGSGLEIDVNFAVNDKAAKNAASADSVDFTSANKAAATTALKQAAVATPTAAPATTSTDDAAWVPKTTQSVNVHDQKTWVCQHPGWWLFAHSGYVTEGGHVECADDLAAYKATQRKMLRRSRADRHSVIAKRTFVKRDTKCYTIHPVNHLSDMKTLALTGNSDTGFASTPALNLAYSDDSAPIQIWQVTSLL